MEHMHTPPSPSALPPPDPHVVALARQCLEEIDSLVDEWAEYVGPLRASYSELVSRQEFRDSAWQAFEVLLRTVARLPVPEHIAGVSERVGEQRARQGVPLDALLQAARVDFRVVWAALVRRAGDEGRAQLVNSAYYVWEAVEHHVTGIMTAYQRTVLEMGRRTEDERRLWFSRLLDSDGRNPTVVQDAARALGFQVAGHFLCAVTPGGGEASLRGVANALRTLGAPLQQQAVASDMVLAVLRKRQPTLRRPYRMWLYPVPSIVAFVGWCVIYGYADRNSPGRHPIEWSLAWLALGCVAFVIWARLEKVWPFGPKEITEEYLTEAAPNPEPAGA